MNSNNQTNEFNIQKAVTGEAAATLTKAIYPSQAGTDLGIILLDEKFNLLEETVITADITHHETNKSSYLITDGMRQKTGNSFELFNQIHGLRYNKISNTIQTTTNQPVILLVNGIQHPEGYIRSIPIAWIYQVEIINEPHAHQISDGQMTVVNILLKEDYKGLPPTT